MTDTSTPANAAIKAPNYIAYHVRDRGEGQKGFWTRIGVAWAHGDGKGINIVLDCIPVDGRLTLRVASEANA